MPVRARLRGSGKRARLNDALEIRHQRTLPSPAPEGFLLPLRAEKIPAAGRRGDPDPSSFKLGKRGARSEGTRRDALATDGGADI
jgi:hypothetical protein